MNDGGGDECFEWKCVVKRHANNEIYAHEIKRSTRSFNGQSTELLLCVHVCAYMVVMMVVNQKPEHRSAIHMIMCVYTQSINRTNKN